MRNNLDIAGSIKVGGSLSLPAITVGGSSTFGQIHVNDQLTVAGNTTLQGTLTVQKGLTVSGSSSFGSLSASTINTSSLQINGDFIVNRHIGVSGGTPGRSGGTALGGGGTASVSGSDTVWYSHGQHWWITACWLFYNHQLYAKVWHYAACCY
jgi:cytoskeletal protein CcmA (bactofilin family)